MAIGITPEPPLLDSVGIYVGDKRFEEWTDYGIPVDIFTPSNQFSMRCGALQADVIKTILPGREVSIYFGDGSHDNEHIVITGWLEDFDDVTAKDTWSTDVSGRDRASDLLENSVPQDLVVKNRAMYDIAQDICSPLGLDVIIANDANRIAVADKKLYKKLMAGYEASMLPYNSNVAAIQKLLADTFEVTDAKDKQFKQILAANGIKPPLKPPFIPGVFQNLRDAEPKDGESCWEFLARLAAKLEVWLWMAHDGTVVIQRPRYDQEPMYLFINSISEPFLNNVVNRRYSLSIAGKPTKLTRIGRVKTDGKRERTEIEYSSTRIVPSSSDAVIVGVAGQQDSDYLQVSESFSRERWMVDEDSSTADELARKAWYALKASEAGFLSIELVVKGHDQGGVLYTPDTVCRLVDEKLGLDGNYYIAACEYEMGVKAPETEGKQTRITLTPLYAWSPQE